jgi:cytochrome c551/c552
MDYSKFIRDDINFKILSNVELTYADIEKDKDMFMQKLKNYDLGVWSKNIMLIDENLEKSNADNKKNVNNIKFNEIEIYNSKVNY